MRKTIRSILTSFRKPKNKNENKVVRVPMNLLLSKHCEICGKLCKKDHVTKKYNCDFCHTSWT